METAAFTSRFLTDYELIRCLGSGGFGVVLEARDKLVDINYAVKCIALPNEEKSREKVMREVKNHARLGHQHIVRYYVTWLEHPPPGWQAQIDSLLEEKTGSNVGAFDLMADDSDSDGKTPEGMTTEESSGGIEFRQSAENFPSRLASQKKERRDFLYIAMELCCRGTLRNWLYDNQKRDSQATTKQFRQICSGVAYIHEQKLVHRDLKPENIYLSASGCIKIGDFGLSTHLKRSRGGPMMNKQGIELSHYVGTEMYMAPEIKLSNMLYTNKVDIFSLGIILLELLTPIATESELCKLITNAKMGQFPKSLNTMWCSLLARMLNLDPEKRPDAKEILRVSPKTPKSKAAR